MTFGMVGLALILGSSPGVGNTDPDGIGEELTESRCADLIAQLSSGHPGTAYRATEDFYQLGASALGCLADNLNNVHSYGGACGSDALSSDYELEILEDDSDLSSLPGVPVKERTVGQVSLYLVAAIAYGDFFFAESCSSEYLDEDLFAFQREMNWAIAHARSMGITIDRARVAQLLQQYGLYARDSQTPEQR